MILSELGTGADALAAARGLVAAEQNFNPFNVAVPAICSDATLPVNELLRGIIPLVDPAVTGSDVENAASKSSLTTQLEAAGLSVAQVMVNAGFSNFTTKDAAGTAGKAPAAAAGGAAAGSAASIETASSAAAATSSAVAVASSVASTDCIASTTFITVTKGVTTTTASAAAATSVAATPAQSGAVASGAAEPGQAGSTLNLDFGTCTPTIKFEAGLNGRKDTEFTFQAIDPVVNKGQQEALNPNIITNRICDQLGNVCGAAADAITACTAAKAQISALGTRDQSTADAWNTALGFAGTNTNPDNAPQTGLVGHT